MDFTRINPLEFHGSKVEENPQKFIDEVYTVVMIMGVTPVENAELAIYQLKGFAQVWFNQWKEEMVVDAGALDWEKLKVSFLDRFFPLEMIEVKVLKFINLHQGNMSVKEYALEFTQLSRYAPTIVVDPRARMRKFISGMSEMVVKECRTAMLINGSSNATPRFNKERVFNPKSQGGNGSGSSLSTCVKYGRKHGVRCLADSNACFCCENMDHMIRNCPSVSKNEEDNRRQAHPSSGSSGSQKQNMF
ncbi:uncharacterized protein LOC125830718 [Solanum verrucosum]|nr:uncharacterized protein LOC125830718 [Solanum verrucosum]